jgi:hypothetical protein
MRIPLPAGWGKAILNAPGCHSPRSVDTARSYDHLGRQLVWIPDRRSTRGRRFACDIEHRSRPSPDLAARFGLSKREFLRRWVTTEVLAKLLDVPVLVLLERHGLSEGPGRGARVVVRESRDDGIVAAFGFLDEGSAVDDRQASELHA